jgi:transposase
VGQISRQSPHFLLVMLDQPGHLGALAYQGRHHVALCHEKCSCSSKTGAFWPNRPSAAGGGCSIMPNTLALLQTLPGVDLIGSAMLLVEIGSDMDAFGSADRLASWVGICPGNNESAGKRKSERVRKGNLYVRRLLCEFAHAASRTQSVFQSKFKSLIVRRGHKRAIVALAHKILRTLYFMIKRREHYRDSATDYDALSVQRNAPRWIKALTRFGFIPAAA